MSCLLLTGMTLPGAIAFIYYARPLPKVHTCVCAYFVGAFFAEMGLPGGKRLHACSAGQCDRVSVDRSLEIEQALGARIKGDANCYQHALSRGEDVAGRAENNVSRHVHEGDPVHITLDVQKFIKPK